MQADFVKALGALFHAFYHCRLQKRQQRRDRLWHAQIVMMHLHLESSRVGLHRPLQMNQSLGHGSLLTFRHLLMPRQIEAHVYLRHHANQSFRFALD